MGITASIDISVEQRRVILDLINKHLPNTPIWAFGSRVKWITRSNSDLDLVAFATPQQAPQVSALKEAFEESNLPFRVDLLVWDKLPENFQRNIQERYVVLVEGNDLEQDWVIRSKLGTVKVEEIAEVKSGKRLPEGHRLVEQVTTYPYIRLVDIANGRIQKDGLQYLTPETRECIKRYIVNTNDICLAIVGHSIGMVFYIDEKWNNVNLTENAARITNVDDSFNPRFIYYYLISKDGQNEIISRKVGSAQGKLPLYNIKSLELPRIPRDIQNTVVSILDSLSFKIELNRQTNQTLEQIAQAIFKSWFVDFEPVKAKIAVLNSLSPRERAGVRGQELAEQAAICAISGKTPEQLAQLDPQTLQQLKATAALFPDALVDSELGEIPDGWEVQTIEDVVKRLTAKKRYTKDQVESFGEVPVYEQGADILLGYHNEQAGFVATPDTPIIIFGDHTCVTHLSCESFDISQNVIALAGKGYPTMWVYYAIQGKQEFQEYRRHWSELIIKEIVAPLPEIATEYVERVTALYKQKEQSVRESKTLEQLRDSLLPKLLSGEINLNNL